MGGRGQEEGRKSGFRVMEEVRTDVNGEGEEIG